MNATTNTLPGVETTNNASGRPVLQSIEHYENEIMNIVSTAVGNGKTDRDKGHAYISALESRIDKNNPIFKRILGQKTYFDITGVPAGGVPVQKTLSDNLDASTRALRDAHVLSSTTPPSFSNLINDPITPLIIRSIAEYYHYKKQEEVNNFDAIYLGQAGETESSTAQQIEAAAQRAELGKPTLYYRNKKPLRIEWDPVSKFTAQYLAPNGLVNTLPNIADTATLVRRIDTDSQNIKGLLADNVQQNVELRESKKADHKQIIAAIDFINQGQNPLERAARSGFYSIDNRNFAIRGQGAGDFSVDIIEANGTVIPRDNINQNAVTSLIDTACNAYEKSKDRKETVETPDMGTQFSEAVFRKLCRDITNSKDKVGEYQLSGQKYTVREVTAAHTTGTPPARYFAQYPNPQGRTVGFPNPVGTGEEIVNITAHIAANTRTSTNKGNCTRDMANEFSANIFRELCEEIGESKNGRGTYTLAGKKYEVRVDQPLPADVNAAVFHAEYPNRFGVKVLAAGATIDALLNLPNGDLSHIHVHDPEKPHPFEKAIMLELCELADAHPNERQEFDFHGKSCFVYKPTGLDRAKARYCVDIPNNKGGVDTIKAMWPKGLYDKFIEHADKLHHAAEHKGTEAKESGTPGSEEKKEASGEGHEQAGHGDGGHDTAMDKTFKAILPGWLAKLAIKGKNVIPSPIRKTAGITTSSAVAGVAGSVAVTGGLYGASALGLTTMGTAAALSFFAPVALTIGGATAGYKFYKWWKGSGEDGKGEGHGKAH